MPWDSRPQARAFGGVVMPPRRWREDDFGCRIVRQLRCARHDDERPRPWALVGDEGELLVHPPRDAVRIGFTPGNAIRISPLDDTEVRLHPHDGVQEMRDLAPAGSYALNDGQCGARRNLDSPRGSRLSHAGGRKATA